MEQKIELKLKQEIEYAGNRIGNRISRKEQKIYIIESTQNKIGYIRQ